MSESTNHFTAVAPEIRGSAGEWPSVAFLIFVCLTIVFVNLGGAGLFEPDEGRNAEKAREILVLNDWITPHHNFLPTLDKPIAFYWPVALSFELFGFTEWAARLPSALAALGCLLLVYQFASRRWGSAPALWSCLILVTSIEFFFFARLVILDMSLTFFLTLALYSFYSAADSDNPESMHFPVSLIYAALGMGTLIKGPIAVVIPGMVIFAYLLVSRRWSLLPRLGSLRGAFVFIVIVAPWYLWAEAKNPGYLRYFLLEEHFIRYLTPEFNRGAAWYYFFIVVAVGFLPWSLLLPGMIKRCCERNGDSTNLFLVLWTILPFLFFSLSKSKLPQYILPIYPPLALLMGRYLADRFAGVGPMRWRTLMIPWLFMLSSVVYLFCGAAWPKIVAPQIRGFVVEEVVFLAACMVLLLAIFWMFLNGRRNLVWSRRGACFFTTAAALLIFCLLWSRVMVAVSRDRGSKQLAQISAPFIGFGDRIAFYDTYLSGVAFYIDAQKPLWLVQHEQKDRIMGSNYLAQRRPAAKGGRGQVVFSFSEFAKEWHRKDLALRVIVKEKNLQRLSRDVGAAPRVLTTFDEYLLVTNH